MKFKVTHTGHKITSVHNYTCIAFSHNIMLEVGQKSIWDDVSTIQSLANVSELQISIICVEETRLFQVCLPYFIMFTN